MSINEELLVEILKYLVVGGLGVVLKLVWERLAELRRMIDVIATEQDEIKYNYLARFEEVKTLMTRGNADIVDRINTLHISISDSFVRRHECDTRHKLERKNIKVAEAE